jgi:hypothetical protein
MCNSAPFLDDYHEVFRAEFINELYGLYPNNLRSNFLQPREDSPLWNLHSIQQF